MSAKRLFWGKNYKLCPEIGCLRLWGWQNLLINRLSSSCFRSKPTKFENSLRTEENGISSFGGFSLHLRSASLGPACGSTSHSPPAPIPHTCPGQMPWLEKCKAWSQEEVGAPRANKARQPERKRQPLWKKKKKIEPKTWSSHAFWCPFI